MNYSEKQSTKGSKSPSLIPLFLILLIIFTGCKGRPEGKKTPAFSTEPAYGDIYIEASIGDASVLNPILATDSASGAINGYVYNGLVKYDKDIVLTGELAESWDVSDDGLVLTFHLCRGVKWHDGVPFTAGDVEFTYKKLIDPDVMTPYASDFKLVKKFEVLDDYTVRITYGKLFSPALESWGMGIVPKHIYEGSPFNMEHPANRKPVGTGKYKFIEWKTDEQIVLEANPDYFEGKPYLDRIIYRIIPDKAVQFMELSKGGIDSMGLTPDQFEKETNTPEFLEAYNKFRYSSFGYTYLGYNLSCYLFKEKKVRQALSHAVNKKEIIDGILLGLGNICTGPFPEQSWAYNPNVRRYEYNPGKAKMLLEECGWVDSDNDGILDKNGKPFKFTIMTNHGNKERELSASIIQSNLKKVGIKVSIRIIEWSAFLEEYIHPKKFEAVIIGWSLSRDPDCYSIWHSSQIKERQYNFVSYNNPEVDSLLVEGRETFDREKRKIIYHKIHAILAEDQPYTFLYVGDALPAISSRIHGIKVAPIGIGYNFIKWYVPKTLQKYTM